MKKSLITGDKFEGFKSCHRIIKNGFVSINGKKYKVKPVPGFNWFEIDWTLQNQFVEKIKKALGQK